MSSKPYRIPNSRDRLRKQQIEIRDLQALIRVRNTPRAVSSTSFAGVSAAGDTGGGTGNFLSIGGGTMNGNIAFDPNLILVSDGRVDLDPGSNDPSNSSYILVTGQGSPDDIRFIDGAERNGQFLIYQGTNQQIQNILNANLLSISNIVGDGSTTVTVTLSDTGTLVNGSSINVIGTTNFDITDGIVANLVADTSFTYERAAGASTTPESFATIQDGNILTSDGTTLVLDGTTSLNGAPEMLLIFDATAPGGAWRVLATSEGAGGTGISFPIIPPVNVLGSVGTNQNIDLSLTTAHSTSMTLTASIDITFSGFPTSGNQIEWEVEITQDGTGGHVVTWPAEVVNPPTLNTAAGTIVVIVFRTNDGGTTVRVGNTVTTTSTGGTGTLSGLTIDVTKDWQTFAITNMSAIQYVDTGAVVRGSISGDTGGPLRLATATAGSFVISDVITDIATFDDTTGLTMEGSHVINMSNNIINTIAELQFSNANAHTPSNELSIAFDTIDDALKYAVPLTTDSHRFFADTDLLAAISRVGVNEGLLSINSVTATFLQATNTLLLSTFNNATPTNGEIWRDLGDGKFKFRQNGVTDEIGPSTQIIDGNTSATVLDSAPSFAVVLNGIQKYSISNTRVDYADLDLFGINQINMTDSSSNDISTLTASATGLLLNIISSSDVYDLQIGSVDAFHVDNLRTRILSTTPNTTDPELSLFRDDPSPLDNTDVGTILFESRNDAAEQITYSAFGVGMTDVSDGLETAVGSWNLMDGGLLVQQFRLEDGALRIRKFSSIGSDVAALNLEKEDSTPLAGESVAAINFNINDSGVITPYAKIQVLTSEVTDAGLWKVQVRSDNILSDALIIEGNDNNTQFQFLMSSNGNTRMQPLSSAVMGYFVTSQVTDFTLNLGTEGSLEIPRLANGSPSLTDLNQAFGAFDGAHGYESVDERLYIRESSTRWVFFNADGAVV